MKLKKGFQKHYIFDSSEKMNEHSGTAGEAETAKNCSSHNTCTDRLNQLMQSYCYVNKLRDSPLASLSMEVLHGHVYICCGHKL